MNFKLPKDAFNNYMPPKSYICDVHGNRIQELTIFERKLSLHWDTYSEFSFTINRIYTDELTGELKEDPNFDLLEGLRIIEVEDVGKFLIQDPETVYSDGDTKTIKCISLEYATSSKFIENFYVNNGEYDSVEVTYEMSTYGENPNPNQMYTLAREDKWDSHENYYHRVYQDAVHYLKYTYEQVTIRNEEEYKEHFGPTVSIENALYIKGYANVQFYNPSTPELSLLHCIFKYIPEWKIGNVDYSLWAKERKIEQDRISVYDMIMNEVKEKFDCMAIWNTLTMTVDFIPEKDEGLTEDDEVQPEYDSDIYISKETLANNVDLKYSTDDIKTRIKISGDDGLDVREVNVGYNYITNLDYYANSDWFDQELLDAYNKYKNTVGPKLYTKYGYLADNVSLTKGHGYGITILYKDKKKSIRYTQNDLNDTDIYACIYNNELWYFHRRLGTIFIECDGPDINSYKYKYSEAQSHWVDAYNNYNKLMNNVPEDLRATRIGDYFDTLYCTYNIELSELICAYVFEDTNINQIMNYPIGTKFYFKDKDGNELSISQLRSYSQWKCQNYVFKVSSTESKVTCLPSNIKTLRDKLVELGIYKNAKQNDIDNLLIELKDDRKNTVKILVQPVINTNIVFDSVRFTKENNEYYLDQNGSEILPVIEFSIPKYSLLNEGSDNLDIIPVILLPS